MCGAVLRQSPALCFRADGKRTRLCRFVSGCCTGQGEGYDAGARDQLNCQLVCLNQPGILLDGCLVPRLLECPQSPEPLRQGLFTAASAATRAASLALGPG